MTQFRKLVSQEVEKVCGLSIDDLADFDLWNYFDENMSPEEAKETAKEAAADLLEEEGFPFDE
jgi:hypothetical protein